MPNRLYIVPAIGDGSRVNPRRPKYFDTETYAAMDYGFQPIFLVAANLSPAEDAAIIANADVTPFPFDLTPQVGGGSVQEARNALEAALIPAQWISGQTTWVQVARMVGGTFQYMQRLNFYMGNSVLIDSGAKLNVRWSQIPPDVQNSISQAAVSLGYSLNPAANDQLRVIMESLATQWGTKPFFMGDMVF